MYRSMRKSNRRTKNRKRHNKTRRNNRKTRHIVRGGVPRDRRIPLTPEQKQRIIAFTREEYGDHERLNEALSQINNISFDPDYESAFDGNKFSGEHKVYWQAKDKVEAFFKYSQTME